MSNHLIPWAVTMVTMALIDLLWLGVIARTRYEQGLGPLLAERPRIGVAALFYAVFAFGLMVFVVVPGDIPASWERSLAGAALFGFVAYATYNLTNLATLRGWPAGLAMIDLAWGTALSVVAAAAGRFAHDVSTWPT
ncbi:MAG: DUF2177 family protein [Burkholderiales bacterium]